MRIARFVVAWATFAAIGVLTTATAVAQDQAVVAHSISVSEDGSSLELELTNGKHVTIELSGGALRINGQPAGQYTTGGEFEESWQSLLNHGGELSSADLVEALRAWDTQGLEDVEEQIAVAITSSLENLDVIIEDAMLAAGLAAGTDMEIAVAEGLAAGLAQARAVGQGTNAVFDISEGIVVDLENPRGLLQQLDAVRQRKDDIEELGLQVRNVENGRVHVGDLNVSRSQTIQGSIAVLSGDVTVSGAVDGNLIAINGNVILRTNGRVDGDVIAINGTVTRAGGVATGQIRSIRDLAVAQRGSRTRVSEAAVRQNAVSASEGVGRGIASLLGFFVALACIGFGFTYFMPHQLDIVSETVSESFGKSFFAGLLAQPLLLPLSAMLICGLAITVVGLPLAALAALAIPLAVVSATVLGYLAAAKSVGNSYLTRRIASGHAVMATPYRSLIYGVAGMLTIWAPAVILGWIPLVGQLLLAMAVVTTWVMATAGIGAAILSRAGLRATFVANPSQPYLTDEHYWPAEASQVPSRRDRPLR